MRAVRSLLVPVLLLATACAEDARPRRRARDEPEEAPSSRASASAPAASSAPAPIASAAPPPSASAQEDPTPIPPPVDEQPVAPAPDAKTPRGAATIGAVVGGGVANAAAVVSGMSAGFRRCYNKGLVADPTMKGSVRITAKIGPSGEVVSATPSAAKGLSPSVVTCLATRVSSATFAAPEGGGAVLVVPITLTPAP